MKRSFFISLENLKFYFNFSFRNCCYDSNMKSKRVGGVGPKWYNSIKYQFRKRDVMNQSHILIVEDERDIAVAIEAYLSNQGYKVSIAGNGIEALEIVESTVIDLAIVDVMMPKMDGITFTMKLRENYHFPVIMLSAKSEEVDQIMGLNMGADDYVTKPFRPLELLARVNSQLRRYKRFSTIKQEENHHLMTIGGLEMNTETKEFTVDEIPVKLTPIEYKILNLLMKHPGRVFPAEEIYERIWNENAVNTDTILVHIRNIREKIEINPKNPKYLKVVWGVGYKIEKQ